MNCTNTFDDDEFNEHNEEDYDEEDYDDYLDILFYHQYRRRRYAF